MTSREITGFPRTSYEYYEYYAPRDTRHDISGFHFGFRILRQSAVLRIAQSTDESYESHGTHEPYEIRGAASPDDPLRRSGN